MTRKDKNFYVACGVVITTVILTDFIIRLFAK